MYARVLRKWSLQTKLQIFMNMWRLLLLTLLLLCLYTTPVTCLATASAQRLSASRSTSPAHALAFAPVISSAAATVTANAAALVPAAQTPTAAAMVNADTPAAAESAAQPLNVTVVKAEAVTVGDIIEESFYIPVVDGDDADSNIYGSGATSAAGVDLVGRSSSSNGKKQDNFNRDGSSRIFSSSSVMSIRNGDSSGPQQYMKGEQLFKQTDGSVATDAYADNLAYAFYRGSAPAAFRSSIATEPSVTGMVTQAPTTVFSPQFSAHHVANDDSVVNDGNEEDEVDNEGEGDEEDAEDVDDDADVDLDEHTSDEGDADYGRQQQQKVPNNKNSHIINLFKSYTHSNINNYNTNYNHNSNSNLNPNTPQPPQHSRSAASPFQPAHTATASSSDTQAYVAGRRSYKTRRHVAAEQHQLWSTIAQQQQQPLRLHNANVGKSAQYSSTSTPLPIAAYPTKKVYQLVNGKNLTRIVHLFPPTHYRIAAYEIPSSLPYRGELTEQQRRMLQHQHEQQLQQDQTARSRRDSRVFGLAQSMSSGLNAGYYGMQQSPQPTLGQQMGGQQQQFQRLQQSSSANGNSWQQMSGNMFQRQTHAQQLQRQQQPQQHHHKHQHSNGEQNGVGANNNHRNTHHNSHHNSNGKHNQRQRQRKRPRRYCSARDPAQLAFEAPIVFEGKITSMSPDRRHNFAATVQVLNAYKQQIGYQVKREQFVRLQFAYINSSGECDIYREQLRPRGQVRGDELELQRTYLFFVQQIDMRNFTILGQPIRKTRRVVEAVKDAVSENYAQPASIRSITNNRTMEIGRELHIVCKVQGKPPPKVTWFKDGKSINRNRKLYKFRHFKKRSELIIRSFNISDTGRYECRAKNKINQEPDRHTILIKADPEPRLTGGIGNVCPDDAAEFCLNGGTCKFFSEIGSYSCICPEGFIGERCDRKEVNNISPNFLLQSTAKYLPLITV
ncbi:homeobox protein 2 isoform X2 [Zeugodacus cucurbitae]|uniref:homeobox protein 2 isoform X2 n=1 Tax=Zeugodacus cucurbitae TaxID=28588 RepID=UPI0023D8FD9E|nr:homeobox protein 2 isoform X2 [Zeugodacus cucurbitae]